MKLHILQALRKLFLLSGALLIVSMCVLGAYRVHKANAVDSSVNLIANPSLEINTLASGLPDKWSQDRYGSNSTKFSYLSTGFDGVKSVRIDMTKWTSGDASWIFSDVPVTSGAKYTYSNYYRANVATSIDVRYKLKSGNYSYVNLSSAPASTTWKAKSFTISVPANAVALTVMHSIAKVGYLETDAYSLTPQDTSTPTPTPTATPTPTQTPSPTPTATPSPVVNNLIINPSLEIQDTNGKPSNWHSNSWGTNTSSFTYPVAGIDGVRAAKVSMTAYTSGDAKWYFDPVTVNPNKSYTFSNSYNSDVASILIAQFTLNDQTVVYQDLANLPATNNTWTTVTKQMMAPDKAVSVSVFHIIQGIGQLTVDKYSLSPTQVDPNDLFSQGVVSLTFDDGWTSHYDTALPILNTARS